MSAQTQTKAIVTETARVTAILPTKNPLVFQMMVRSEREKPNRNSADADFNIFMSGFGVNEPERLITYRTVSQAYLDAYGINFDPVAGTILNKNGYTLLEGLKRTNNDDNFPETHPACKIWVNETFEQRTWAGGQQKPKINPSTSAILCNQGRPIYLNRELTFDVSKEDVYISHDNSDVSTTVMVDDVTSPFGDLNA